MRRRLALFKNKKPFTVGYKMGYTQAFSDLFDELELYNYEDSDGLKVKYLRHAVARLLNEEEK